MEKEILSHMAKKTKTWIWVSLIVVALIIGIVIGNFIFFEKRSDRIPPQVKFITSNSNCLEHRYGEFNVPTQKFYKFERCIIDKQVGGELWCSCS